MSITDPSNADDVQPEGQGDGGTQGAPYQEYLDRIPEEVRGDVEPVFKDWDGNVTKRFQEQAEFRKQWEPLADTGVNQLSPEQVSYAVQLFQAMDDPSVMQPWIEAYVQQHGLTLAQQQAAAAEASAVDEFGYQDPQQQLEKLLEERLGPLSQQLQQFGSRFEQQDQQARESEALDYINGQVKVLETEHGAFDDKTKELLNTLAGRYIESDPMNAIPKAWGDLQQWRNDVEKSALQAKVDAPTPAETGGVPSVTPETHSRIDAPGVKEQALQFLRNQNRA